MHHEQTVTTLLQRLISESPPHEWKRLFSILANITFRVKHTFRESLELVTARFAEGVHPSFMRLVDDSLAAYGVFDRESLMHIDFLDKTQLSDQLASLTMQDSSAGPPPPEIQLLSDITRQWMQLMVDQMYPPVALHHTQAVTVLLMSRFLACLLLDKRSHQASTSKARAFFAQMSTGEGKSLVIAVLAIFIVKLHGMHVHVLQSNSGLLKRDFAKYKPLFDRFNIQSSLDLNDNSTQICYCLKDGINRRFLRTLVEGKLDAELGRTVLVVDEVDDLIVNERPNNLYVKRDAQRSSDMVKSYQVLKKKPNSPRPSGVDEETWNYAKAVRQYAEQKTRENQHYRVMEANGKRRVVMLDDQGQIPKVALTTPWLIYLNYTLCDIEPFSETRHACVCTPYIFKKYAGLFGLSASVGGKAELNYLAKTYRAIKFDVPRLLDTCTGEGRNPVFNRGIELCNGPENQLVRVLALAGEHFRKVPVLIITTGNAQLTMVYDALVNSGAGYGIPVDEVQQLAMFNKQGQSLAAQWPRVIDAATTRQGGFNDLHCRITVTDGHGGRGHDFQVLDKESNTNGGMLVIATSIPGEREWIQWIGRTARLGQPGQFYVVLDSTQKPLNDPAKLHKLSSMAADDAKLQLLLDYADESIGERLRTFEGEQERGERLNQLTEKYYLRCPRSFDDPWPKREFLETDSVLRMVCAGAPDPSALQYLEIAAGSSPTVRLCVCVPLVHLDPCAVPHILDRAQAL